MHRELYPPQLHHPHPLYRDLPGVLGYCFDRCLPKLLHPMQPPDDEELIPWAAGASADQIGYHQRRKEVCLVACSMSYHVKYSALLATIVLLVVSSDVMYILCASYVTHGS